VPLCAIGHVVHKVTGVRVAVGQLEGILAVAHLVAQGRHCSALLGQRQVGFKRLHQLLDSVLVFRPGQRATGRGQFAAHSRLQRRQDGGQAPRPVLAVAIEKVRPGSVGHKRLQGTGKLGLAGLRTVVDGHKGTEHHLGATPRPAEVARPGLGTVLLVPVDHSICFHFCGAVYGSEHAINTLDNLNELPNFTNW
jgi:hypothetical protein